jgi:hypothetical protein
MINFLTVKHFYRNQNGLCIASPDQQQNCRHFKQSQTAKYLICEHDRLNLCGWDAVDHVCELMEGRG